MDLGAFLQDDSFGGSWADEEVDMTSIGVPTSNSTAAPFSSNYSSENSGFDGGRRDREEYPVPDAPPFKARVANLPYEATEDALVRFFEDRMQAQNCVEDVKLPMDMMTDRPKGFAFVTFTEKAFLEEALMLTMSEFNGRKMYVNVAAPQKQDVFDMDWRSGRSGPLGREPREEVDLDWGAARSGGPLPPRERDRPQQPRRRLDEPELDWTSARNASAPMPPRERRPRRDEPELDWSAARTAAPVAPPREREEPRESRGFNSEWASGRGAQRKKDDRVFDWKRGQALPPRQSSRNAAAKKDDAADKDQVKPQKSMFNVLALEDEEAEASAPAKEEASAEETGLEAQVSELAVEDSEWKTVGK